MSPDEILADLRDIHLPVSPGGAASDLVFNAWPLGIVGLLLIVLLIMRHRQRSAAQRRLLQEVSVFAQKPEAGGMQRLLDLRSQIAAQGMKLPSLPPECFTPHGAQDGEVLKTAAAALQRAVSNA